MATVLLSSHVALAEGAVAVALLCVLLLLLVVALLTSRSTPGAAFHHGSSPASSRAVARHLPMCPPDLPSDR